MPFTEAEFEFCYDVPSFLSFYNGKLSLAGLGRITGISQAQLSQYMHGYRHPSQKTSEKNTKNTARFCTRSHADAARMID
jgi:hypothetical protein